MSPFTVGLPACMPPSVAAPALGWPPRALHSPQWVVKSDPAPVARREMVAHRNLISPKIVPSHARESHSWVTCRSPATHTTVPCLPAIQGFLAMVNHRLLAFYCDVSVHTLASFSVMFLFFFLLIQGSSSWIKDTTSASATCIIKTFFNSLFVIWFGLMTLFEVKCINLLFGFCS